MVATIYFQQKENCIHFGILAVQGDGKVVPVYRVVQFRPKTEK